MAKLDKKIIEKPDRLIDAANAFWQYFRQHQKRFYIGAGVLVLIVAALVSWYFYDLSIEKDAQQLYAQAANISAQTARNQDKTAHAIAYAMAAKMYEEVLKKYPGSNAARIAHYDLGNIYYNMGEYDKSIKELNEFISDTTEGNDLREFAFSGLGYCYAAKKQYPKALEMFERSVRSASGAIAGMTYNTMAEISEAQGKKQEALTYYKKALEQKNEPIIEALIKRKIAELS